MVDIAETSCKETKTITTIYRVSKKDLIKLCWGGSGSHTDENTSIDASFSCMGKIVHIDEKSPLMVNVVVKSEY